MHDVPAHPGPRRKTRARVRSPDASSAKIARSRKQPDLSSPVMDGSAPVSRGQNNHHPWPGPVRGDTNHSRRSVAARHATCTYGAPAVARRRTRTQARFANSMRKQARFKKYNPPSVCVSADKTVRIASIFIYVHGVVGPATCPYMWLAGCMHQEVALPLWLARARAAPCPLIHHLLGFAF